MIFYEYEARKIVELAGIPVTKYGFCQTPEEARKIAEEIGGPTGPEPTRYGDWEKDGIAWDF